MPLTKEEIMDFHRSVLILTMFSGGVESANLAVLQEVLDRTISKGVLDEKEASAISKASTELSRRNSSFGQADKISVADFHIRPDEIVAGEAGWSTSRTMSWFGDLLAIPEGNEDAVASILHKLRGLVIGEKDGKQSFTTEFRMKFCTLEVRSTEAAMIGALATAIEEPPFLDPETSTVLKRFSAFAGADQVAYICIPREDVQGRVSVEVFGAATGRRILVPGPTKVIALPIIEMGKTKVISPAGTINLNAADLAAETSEFGLAPLAEDLKLLRMQAVNLYTSGEERQSDFAARVAELSQTIDGAAQRVMAPSELSFEDAKQICLAHSWAFRLTRIALSGLTVDEKFTLPPGFESLPDVLDRAQLSDLLTQHFFSLVKSDMSERSGGGVFDVTEGVSYDIFSDEDAPYFRAAHLSREAAAATLLTPPGQYAVAPLWPQDASWLQARFVSEGSDLEQAANAFFKNDFDDRTAWLGKHAGSDPDIAARRMHLLAAMLKGLLGEAYGGLPQATARAAREFWSNRDFSVADGTSTGALVDDVIQKIDLDPRTPETEAAGRLALIHTIALQPASQVQALLNRTFGVDERHADVVSQLQTRAAEQAPTAYYFGDWVRHHVAGSVKMGTSTTGDLVAYTAYELAQLDFSDLNSIDAALELVEDTRQLCDASKSWLRKDLFAYRALKDLAQDSGSALALRDVGLASASEVVAFGRGRLTKTLAAGGIADAELVAGQIYNRSQAAQQFQVHALGQVFAYRSAQQIPALRRLTEARPPTVPDWRTLFGSQDACECKASESIHGPGAYLVDTLEFLRHRAIEPVEHVESCDRTLRFDRALDVLLQRRPDLVHIDLTAANAETELPYIDLLCELLEDRIYSQGTMIRSSEICAGRLLCDIEPGSIERIQDFAAISGDAQFLAIADPVTGLPACPVVLILRDAHTVLRLSQSCSSACDWIVRRLRQTTLTVAELAAEPEHANPDAYAALSECAHGFSLPFSLGETLLRSYLKQAGTPRQALRTALALAEHHDFPWAVNQLEMEMAAARVIVAPTQRQSEQFWSLGSGKTFARPTVFDVLARFDWQFADLDALRRSATFGARRKLLLQVAEDEDGTAGDSCDTHDIRIHWDHDEQPIAIGSTPDLLVRFARLRRHLGWSVEQLDRAVDAASIGAGQINEALVVQLAAIRELSAGPFPNLDDVLALFCELTGTNRLDDADSGYRKLFLDPRRSGLDAEFEDDKKLIAFFRELPKGQTQWCEMTAPRVHVLAACLGQSHDDTLLLVDVFLGRPAQSSKVTVGQLSQLYSWVVLRQALAVDWQELRALSQLYADLSGGHALLQSPIDLVDALALDRDIRAMGDLTPALLRYYLFNQVVDGAESAIEALSVKDDKIYQCLAAFGAVARSVPAQLTATEALERKKAGKRFSELAWAPLDDLSAMVEGARRLGLALPAKDVVRATGDKLRDLLDQRLRADPKSDAKQREADSNRYVDDLLDAAGGLPPMLQWASPDGADAALAALRAGLLCYTIAALRLDAARAPNSTEPLTPAEHEALEKAIEDSGALVAARLATLFLYKRHVDVRRSGLAAALAETLEIDAKRAEAFTTALSRPDHAGGSQTLAAFFLELDVASPDWPAADRPIKDLPVAVPGVTDAAAAIRRIGKAARFGDAMRLDDDTVRWMAACAPGLPSNARRLGWLELNEIDGTPPGPVNEKAPAVAGILRRWSELAIASSLLMRYPAVVSPKRASAKVSLHSVFDSALLLNEATAANTTARLVARLARLTALPAALLEALLERAIATAGEASVSWARIMARLDGAVDTLRRSGLDLALASEASHPGCGPYNSDPAQELRTAGAVRKALKKRFRLDAWLTAVSSAQGAIRERKRDALLAYLIGTGRFADANAIFEHLLVDPQMGACMPSSRLVQAHGTVQMFVQRCLMGLEADVVIPAGEREDWAPWDWMKEFRVWEANRKIFLFPENWIEPELRDDKSEFYVEFENNLNQNVLEPQNIERAVIQYLHRLSEVANLDICATYYQFDHRDPVVHVVGRTPSEPHKYYYRQWVGERRWTPWEGIDLDIEGDHLLLFMRNGRMHLTWPVFVEKANKEKPTKMPEKAADWDAVQPTSRWTIQLAISEYSQSQWMPRRVTASKLAWPRESCLNLALAFPIAKFRLAIHELPRPEIVVSHRPQMEESQSGNVNDVIVGSFVLDTCSGQPEAVMPPDHASHLWYPFFDQATFSANRYVEQTRDSARDQLVLLAGPRPFDRPTLLERTPGHFSIQVPQQASPIDLLFALLRMCLSPKQSTSLPTSIGAGLPFAYADRSVSAMFSYTFEFRGDAAGALPVSMSLKLAKAVGKALKVLESPKVRAVVRAALPRGTAGDAALGHLLAYYEQPEVKNVVNLVLEVAGAVSERSPGPAAGRVRPPVAEPVSRLAHPLACELVKEAYRGGMARLYERALQRLDLYSLGQAFPGLDPAFERCEPTRADPAADEAQATLCGAGHRNGWAQAVGFENWDAAAGYNWEIFFHMPFHVAIRLAGEGKFKESLDWFHYIFNPVGVRDEGDSQQTDVWNYWITKPFFEHDQEDYEWQRIKFLTDPGQWIADLSHGGADPGGRRALLRNIIEQFAESIIEWRNRPFVPYQVARHRWVAFQKTVVMRYVDILLQWGDAEFSRFEMEPVFRAAQLYVLAARLLGPRPRSDVKLAPKVPMCYEQMEAGIRAPDRVLELLVASVLPPAVLDGEAPQSHQFNLYSDHFCVPQNENLIELWSRVEDRLFKIRHCQDIDGVKRKLALFAPPIDPALLVRAAAAGLSVDQILADMNAPLAHYRFTYLHQKALEFAQEVRALGGELLSVIERKESDELALLHSRLDLTYARAVLDTRRHQVKEAERQHEAIEKSIEAVVYRKDWYAARIDDGLSGREKDSLQLTQIAMIARLAGQALQLAGGAAATVMDIEFGSAGFGGSPVFTMHYGGSTVARALGYFSAALSAVGDITQTQAGVSAVQAGYERRESDWVLQKDLAQREVAQLDKQRLAAEIRIDIARSELDNQQLQIENMHTIDEYIRNKFGGAKLYDWMQRQITATYYKTYQLAVDMGMKAERCMEQELPASSGAGVQGRFVGSGYWDGQRKGLLAANGLIHDLRRMEQAYIDRNERELEITKHVSLAMLNPMQLLKLRASGTCSLSIPEAVFDLDFPGHYRRRIKSVSLSLPCVAGPYTSVSCQLTLLTSCYRSSASRSKQDLAFDPVPVTSIATSSGQNDSGLFELNFRDERYLPFEGAGAASEWRLALPDVSIRQFDYAAISDAILHIRYTARDGGTDARDKVSASMAAALKTADLEAGRKGVWSMFSLRHDMPDHFALLRAKGEVQLKMERQWLSSLSSLVNGVGGKGPERIVFAVLREPGSLPLPGIEWKYGTAQEQVVNFIETSPKTTLLLSDAIGGAAASAHERDLGATFFKPDGVLLKADLGNVDALHDLLVLMNFGGG
jgi:hypothetical protein